MGIFYALIGRKPDLMVCGNWLNLIELVKTIYGAFKQVKTKQLSRYRK